MPPQPILTNDAQRRWVIAGLMALLLLLSLGVAYALVRRDTLTAANLYFQAPGAWVRASPGAPAADFTVVELFRNKQISTRQLVIAQLKPDLAQDFDQAVDVAHQGLLGPNTELQAIDHQPMRLASGLHAQRWGTIVIVPRRGLNLHALAVLTDGRRYWAVLLTQTITTRQTPPEQTLADLLDVLRHILTTAQPATPVDPIPAPV